MASLGMQIWTALEHSFKSDRCSPLLQKIEKAYNNYLAGHSEDDKLKLCRLILELYAKLYDEGFSSKYKYRVESRLHKDYSEIVSEIVYMIARSCEKDRLENYVHIYDPEKSSDHSFLLFFHSKHAADFAHIVEKYDKSEKYGVIKGGDKLTREEPISENSDGDPTDLIEEYPIDDKYIPGSDYSEERREDNAIDTVRQISNALSAIKISDEKKRLFAIDVTYDSLAMSYKKDSPDIGKSSFICGITKDYQKLKESFVQASDETFGAIITIVRTEKRFPTKGEVAKRLGKTPDYLSGKSKEVRKKIQAFTVSLQN